jgi:ABC-type phosphate transport system substrate-binding protein
LAGVTDRTQEEFDTKTTNLNHFEGGFDMTSKKKLSVALLGVGSVLGLALSAEAQTVVNMGGASAGTPFATEVPLSLCDASPKPVHYVNGPTGSPVITTGKLHTWVCNRAGSPIIIRYSATGSSDGIIRVQQPEANSISNMNFLDHTVLTGCTGPTPKVRPSDSKQYDEYTGCTGGPVQLPVNLGWSDVAGSSYGQTGPLTTTVKPLDDSALLGTQVAIVPFSFVVGNGVQKVSGGAVQGKVTNLSHYQVEALLSRQVTDWRQLGLGTAPIQADGSPASIGTPADATSPVTLCLRTAGSGTKAALDQTVMVIANETIAGSSDLTNAANGVYFGQSNQDVRDCIIGNPGASRPAHPNGFGYMEADQAFAAANPAVGVSRAYEVRMDGFKAYDPTLADPKENLKCGKWKYWVGERTYTRNPSSSDPNVAALISAIISTSADPATISILPSGTFWTAPGQMNVQKNADKGPVNFKALPQPSTCTN